MRQLAAAMGVRVCEAARKLGDSTQPDEAYRAVVRMKVKKPSGGPRPGAGTIIVTLPHGLVDIIDSLTAGRSRSSVIEDILRKEIRRNRDEQ